MGAVQRVAQGLLDVLGIRGIDQLPTELERSIRGHLDLLQFFGQNQLVTMFQNDPALAELGVVAAAPATDPLAQKWAVLYGASIGVVKTATMTAATVTLELTRAGLQNSVSLASSPNGLGPFGATETGFAHVAFWAPYPILLRPPWQVFGRLNILGTDATANCTCIAQVGILG